MESIIAAIQEAPTQIVVVPVLVGLLVEGIVYYVDQFVTDRERPVPWQLLAALLISVIVALVFRLDIFAPAGFVAPGIPWIGSLFTGILFSRVANFANDINDRLRGKADDQT